ncbi:hypothetical protein SAMN02745157_0199 [Kaistia soli DSM 19436]|uniref:Uncharacterized protein n=2 Tax=Kaistia TaxID=166953 RepID=A0A1M5PP27_9HYPH|nr:hypothetical protein SAMN02745157_0199 [Kaistia soli DSM 19436]
MNALLDELDIEAADAEPEGASEQSKLAPLLNLVATARAAYPKYQRRKHTVIIPVDASPAERRRLKRNSRERQDRAAENGGKSRAYRADRRTMTPEQQRQHDSALGAVRKRRWKEKHGAASPASSGD